MAQNRSNESPLDLIQAGRDELVEGSGTVRIVPQVDPHSEHLETVAPDQSRHRHSPQRELQSQSAVLSHAGE